MLNRMNQERIWYQRIRKQSTPTVKTHNSIKTLRNDYNRLRIHRCSYLQPIWSLTCPYRIQESIECFGTQFQQF